MPEQPFLPAVKAQYEELPYPPRNPADEAVRLVHAISSNLLVINHHCFRGRRDFRSGFRCLVAGGGTGDSVIYLAEQLRDYDAEIVYLDLSAASRRVAEERARVRGLVNIRWLTGSIMELPGMGLGEFDYIECAGVLHHLASTEAGLGSLNAVLRDDGAMLVMLYARYGRRPVYDMQSLLRSYLPGGLAAAEKIRWTRQLLDALPGSNSFARDMGSWRSEVDRDGGLGDAGLYDLLLHSQDRCFDVAELYELAASAGLHLLGFAHNADAYDPLNHVRDPGIRGHIGRMDLPRRQALAEQLACNIRTHEFFLARQLARSADLGDEGCALRSFGTLFNKAPHLSAQMVPGRTVTHRDSRHTLELTATPIGREIFAHMDGMTSLGELRKKILGRVRGSTPALVEQELQHLYNLLHPRGYLYLVEAGSYGIKLPDYGRLP